jgi:CBS domain-containing protein
MKVENLMIRDVHTCKPEDGLSVPARIMSNHDCGCVPVIDDEYRVLGMITDRDICMAGMAQEKPLSAIQARTVMAKAPRTCKPTDEHVQAERMMRTHQVRRLPVVDDSGRLVGLISLNDLACEAAGEQARRDKQLTMEEVGLTLAAICAHRQPPSQKVLPQDRKAAAGTSASGGSRAKGSSAGARSKGTSGSAKAKEGPAAR